MTSQKPSIAFFSPLPPAKSGIADYSAAVLDSLRGLATVETFTEKPSHFDASQYDALIYQLGNNPYHDFAYEMALEHPGIVVLHEANLHHLIADITIKRDDWDAYLREVEFNGSPADLAYANRYVVTLERGPNYDLPMLKRVLSRSKAVIVHSEAVAAEVRAQSFTGPVAKIPHGAWIYDVDRMGFRTKLGLTERTPLFGIFGFLKPYKRIAEALRAFRRLIRMVPEARLILVGEAHPELSLPSLISSLGLSAHVRHIDFAPIEDFNGYIGACDAILNLRYPTVGESSGTLLRAFGMGKAVLVSEIGSFREYPDSICLKVPVNESEEDVIYAYMDMLATRPEFAQALGERARNWVGQECNWDLVARKYAEFAVQVANGSAASASVDPVPADEKETLEIDKPVPEAVSVPGEYIEQWVPQENGAREYVGQHLTRFEKTLSITPPGDANQSILEMGAYLHITPSLHTKLGYGEVRGCYFGAAGRTERKEVVSESGERFECMVDLFNAEQDRFPYEDGRFNTVLCCELIEHLPTDPMFMMSELNRVIRPGGHLVLTTPNIASVRALAGILQGFHPMLFPAYVRPRESGGVEARHAREYTAPEIRLMLQDAGFEVTLLETGPFREEPKPEFAWVEHLLDRYILTKEHRGDGIYAVGRKVGPVKDRWPAWLYV